jgi:anthranilate synthase component 1
MKFSPNISDFEKIYNAKKAQIVYAKIPGDLITPVMAVLKLKNTSKYNILLESVEEGRVRGRYSIIALQPDLIWKYEDKKITTSTDEINFIEEKGEVFTSFRKFLASCKLDIPKEIPEMASGAFGFMGYDMVRDMENIGSKNKKSIGLPEALYFRPKITIVFDNIKDEIFISTPIFYDEKITANQAYNIALERINDISQILDKNIKISNEVKQAKVDFKSDIDQATYAKMVQKAKEYITAGDIFQVVLSRRFYSNFSHDPIEFYRSLRRVNPSPYMFCLSMEGFNIIGSSPEILVKLKDKKVTIRPIAGTRKRGETEAEDKANEKDLLADEKELSEHIMLVDLGRNDVGKVAKAGTVKVTDKMFIERYSHVMHIVSNVEGELRDDADAVDALIAGFPAGTVSGAPKIRAMEIIEELENERREFYAGTVGYFSANGNMDTCITLRTALIKDGKIYLQSGGGIVADSTEEGEFQETENKARALKFAAEIVF